ncbi:MAG: permease, partial [Dehalococcoidales bacterium]|nr:permease [Dehalococcoidales bacterium]
KGMGAGAVVALIIGGAGMSIPEISLLAAIFKRRLVAVFIAGILIVAVLAGFLASLLTAINF